MKYIITMIFILVFGLLYATRNIQTPEVEARAINVSRVIINTFDDGSPNYHCWNQTRTVDKELPIGESIHTYIEEKCSPRGGEK